MLSNFLIGLREGLEASLVVGILVAYLIRSGHRRSLLPMWIGVAAAVILSGAVGGFLTLTSHSLSFRAQEGFGGTMSIIAVVFVTGMIFWMRKQSRFLSAEIREKVDEALQAGTIALAFTAFLAVGREGLETALFLWAATQATARESGATSVPLLGAALGLTTAVALGYLIYRGALKINLTRFFTWTGAFLIVVAAGVLAYGVHDLQEARFLPGLGTLAFDVSAAVPPGSWYGTLLKGVFNFSPATTVLELAAWLLYFVPVMSIFLLKVRQRSHPQPRPVTASPVTTGGLSS